MNKVSNIEYIFKRGEEMNKFHRLELSDRNLALLKKISKVESKIDAALEKDRKHSDLVEKASVLLQRFEDEFTNPYNLNIEWIQKNPLMCIFYDKDYVYELRYYNRLSLSNIRKGIIFRWGLTCKKGTIKDAYPVETDSE